jgi:ABC-type phosphonate transport system ATPase subunit
MLEGESLHPGATFRLLAVVASASPQKPPLASCRRSTTRLAHLASWFDGNDVVARHARLVATHCATRAASVGEQQRVAIARAIVNRPRLLLPTSRPRADDASAQEALNCCSTRRLTERVWSPRTMPASGPLPAPG